jgi:hypothetical protein
MAYATVLVSNGVDIKKAPIGFSWTTLFFSGIPALLRGDFLMGCSIIGIELSLGYMGKDAIAFGASVGIAWVYNMVYLGTLVAKKGYHVHSIPPTMTPEMLHLYCKQVPLPVVQDKTVAV